MNVWGPSDLKLLVDAMKCFIPRAAMVHTRSFGPSSTPEPTVLVDDEVVKISAITLEPPRSMEEESCSKSGEISVVYVCELAEIMGKFDLEKAKKVFGVRPGPKYSKLQCGESVRSDEKDITVCYCLLIQLLLFFSLSGL